MNNKLNRRIEELKNVIPLSYKINKSNVDKFIKSSAPELHTILKKIINLTKHISYEELIISLKKLFNKFLSIYKNNNKPIHIFLYDTVESKTTLFNKSNIWILAQIKKYFPNIDFNILLDIESNNIKDGDSIILLDDCIYSGEQLGGEIINNVMSKCKKKNIHLYVLSPYASKEGIDNINSYFKGSYDLRDNGWQLTILSIHEIKPIASFLNSKEIDIFNNIFNIYYQDNTNRAIYKYPVYFDHKLGDDKSTFPLIYSGIVPNEYNKNIIKKINITKYILRQKYIDLLQIYPLFTHCENTREYDIWTPMCPYPPYKKGYKDFLQKIKTTKVYKQKEYIINDNRLIKQIDNITLTPSEQKLYRIQEINDKLEEINKNIKIADMNINGMIERGTDKTMEYLFENFKKIKIDNIAKKENLLLELKQLNTTGGSRKKYNKK